MIHALSRQVRNAGLLLLALLTCAAAVPRNEPASAGETPEAITRRWPPRSRAAASLMIEKYGAPDQYDRDTLVWFNNGEWKRTIVYRRRLHNDPAVTRSDFLEQTIGYLVPNDKVAELKRFNPKLTVSQAAGELTFASDSEAKNRLALNLADEIVTGGRTAADARAFYLKTSRLSAAGKSSSYLDELRFEVDNVRFMTPGGEDQ